MTNIHKTEITHHPLETRRERKNNALAQGALTTMTALPLETFVDGASKKAGKGASVFLRLLFPAGWNCR